jgi:hypothetical protein
MHADHYRRRSDTHTVVDAQLGDAHANRYAGADIHLNA